MCFCGVSEIFSQLLNLGNLRSKIHDPVFSNNFKGSFKCWLLDSHIESNILDCIIEHSRLFVTEFRTILLHKIHRRRDKMWSRTTDDVTRFPFYYTNIHHVREKCARNTIIFEKMDKKWPKSHRFDRPRDQDFLDSQKYLRGKFFGK